MTARFAVERVRADAARLHAFEPPPTRVATVVIGEVTVPALVLGSTQSDQIADQAAAADAGVDVVRRRSGGGSVWLAPAAQLWLDVWIPAGDPLWDDDVARAAVPIGEAWKRALDEHGCGAGLWVHEGGVLDRPWSALVCFAGVGPGEVIDAAGRKWVGISQRRTRDWIRLQTMAHRTWDADSAVALLAGAPRPDAWLQDAVGTIGDIDLASDVIASLG